MMNSDDMKKSVSFVQNLRIPNEQAHSVYVVKSCKALAKLGFKTTLVIPKRKQPPHFKHKNLWSYYGIKKDTFNVKKISVLEIPKLPIKLLEEIFLHIRYPLITWTFNLKALWFIFSSKPSVVITTDREIILLLSLFKIFHNPKVIFEVHIEPKSKYEKLLDSLIRARVDLFVVTVKFLKKFYLRTGILGKKILITPNGVDLDDFKLKESQIEIRKRLGFPPEKKIIGFIGRFETMGMEKGIFKLIKGVSQLKKEGFPIAVSAIGGPKKYIKKYKNYARKCGLSNKEAIFIQQVKPHQVPIYLKAFDICTMLYPFNHHFAHVMSPLKAIEYMASKKTIVSSDLPSIREILSSKEAFFVNLKNQKSLIKNLKVALTDKPLTNSKIKAAYEKAQKLTWDKREKRILSELEQISK